MAQEPAGAMSGVRENFQSHYRSSFAESFIKNLALAKWDKLVLIAVHDQKWDRGRTPDLLGGAGEFSCGIAR